MAHTTFVDNSTPVIAAAWLNDVDSVTYINFGNGISYTGNLTLGTGKTITTPTLTTTTSITTPLIAAPSNTISLTTTGGSPRTVTIDGPIGVYTPDLSTNLGGPVNRWNGLFTTFVDSGATSLVLSSDNGTVMTKFFRVASAINFLAINANTTGLPVQVGAVGGDGNVSMNWYTAGTGSHLFQTGGGARVQFQILDTASANRSITVTGSNGGNPTIGVTAGNLAITPNLVCAGTITHADTRLIQGSVSFTNNAAAQTATLTNSPTAGNPTKWIPINDNGVTRNIPAW